MEEIENDTISLIITSCPYNVGKNYGDKYDDKQDLKDYLKFIRNIFHECNKKLIVGGRICINVANTGRNPYVPLTTYFTNIAEEIGWLHRGIIIWDKGASAGKKTSWGSWLQASNPCLRDINEFILVFSKYQMGRNEKGESTLTKDEFLSYTESIWRINTITTKRSGHPAAFPLEIPERLIKLYSYKNDVVLDPFMGCYDKDTEILTDNGWKKFYEINLKTNILSMHPNNFNTKYLRPNKIFNYKYNGKMLYLELRNTSLLVTPNHNMFCKKRNYNNYKMISANNFYNKDLKIRKSCKWIGNDIKFFTFDGYKSKFHKEIKEKTVSMKSFLKVLGLFLSEGHVLKGRNNRPCGICITQVKQENFEIIRSALLECFGNFKERIYNSKHQFVVNSVQVGLYFNRFGICYNKYIPNEILNLSAEYLEILKKYLIIGDGCISKGRVSYYTSSKQLADDFQILSIKTGKSAFISFREGRASYIKGKLVRGIRNYEVHETNMSEVRIKSREYNKEFWVDYDDNVYCVELPEYHTLLVRRNGKCIWCGNSGTTAIAAVKNNRKFIGYEIEEKFYKLSQKNIEEFK
jgi:site-specific DNA-methyltransferase (adenine-specific)